MLSENDVVGVGLRFRCESATAADEKHPSLDTLVGTLVATLSPATLCSASLSAGIESVSATAVSRAAGKSSGSL